MVILSKKHTHSAKEENAETEKQWDNPRNPEGAEDSRDIEKLKRQKKEAERRKENLTDDDNK